MANISNDPIIAAGFAITDNWNRRVELGSGRIVRVNQAAHKWILTGNFVPKNHLNGGWNRSVDLFTNEDIQIPMPQPTAHVLHADQGNLALSSAEVMRGTQVSVSGTITSHLTAGRFISIGTKVYLVRFVDIRDTNLFIYPGLVQDYNAGETVNVRPEINLSKAPEYVNSLVVTSRGFSNERVTLHERI